MADVTTTVNDGWTGTPRGGRVRIVLAGRRNAGKSRLLNALAGQEVAVVSEVAGTTTDPVSRPMEMLPLGPVTLVDTAGLDEESGGLGGERVRKSQGALSGADVVVLVTGPGVGWGDLEQSVVAAAQSRGVALVPVWNKSDVGLPSDSERKALQVLSATGIAHVVSAETGEGVDVLRSALAKLPLGEQEGRRRLLADLLPAEGGLVLLVAPIDSAAPKGRLILPQQQAVRDALDAHVVSVVVQPEEVRSALALLGRAPDLVVTDSQAFERVARDVPAEIPLTSFSVLFARLKGDLEVLAAGAEAVGRLRDGDRVLIAEACTHHRQEDDIGTVKIPRWLQEKTGRRLVFEHYAGRGWPSDLESYALVVHCGACMLTRREMLARLETVRAASVPVVNYGVLIAALKGILPRALKGAGAGAGAIHNA